MNALTWLYHVKGTCVYDLVTTSRLDLAEVETCSLLLFHVLCVCATVLTFRLAFSGLSSSGQHANLNVSVIVPYM